MALTNMEEKTKFGLMFGGGKIIWEKKKNRKRKFKQGQQGMELWIFVWKLTLIMDSMRLCMNFHAWLVSSLSPNLGFS